MSLADIIAQVSSLPEVAAWPEMARLFERSVTGLNIKWELPLVACRTVGGDESTAIAGAAAVACMQLSLMLVDDMLDEDPRGVYVWLGCANSANLAFAFQATAFRLIEGAPVEVERRAAVYAILAQMALTSSFGQNLDAQNLSGEEIYWQIVRTKSAPFFGASLQIGALLGQASCEVVEHMHDFGLLIGEVIQIYDDLLDSLETPAGPDWKQGRNNLAILYALTADHPDRTQFRALLSKVDDPQALKSAQKIMIRCGAVSYCAYQVFERYKVGLRLLNSLSLADPSPLRDLLARQVEPLGTLLASVGMENPSTWGELI